MDIVLELFDTFLFDRLYATALPVSVAGYGWQQSGSATSTSSSMRELPTPIPSSTQLWKLEPSKYAFMSSWPRDNVWRQSLSLYLVTWYAAPTTLLHS